ncbi:MAG TPA: pyrroloquinoline quinone-dependent dehydrogenase [Pyrinomonadaceae bacterium]|nr:pyrroloquinoline quinone-dependent dehydrogenase [Pyrinomonadaceae bacterium]
MNAFFAFNKDLLLGTAPQGERVFAFYRTTVRKLFWRLTAKGGRGNPLGGLAACLFIGAYVAHPPFANSQPRSKDRERNNLSGRNEWRSPGGDPGGNRFSPLTQINRSNVHRLKMAWTYHMGELNRTPNMSPDPAPPAFECTPLVIDGLLYLITPSGRVIALHAETGGERWTFDSQVVKTGEIRKYHQHRGVAYWEGRAKIGPGLDRRILFGTFDGRLIALDAKTGKPCPDFGNSGTVDLRSGVEGMSADSLYAVASPPAIYQDLVIVGTRLQERPSTGPSGLVRAFNVRSGRLVWEFHTIPRPGEFGDETWAKRSGENRSGANVWTLMSVDAERGIVFLPVASPTTDFYGGDRAGQNLFGNSLVALDAKTGRRLWHFQMVHHDIWDYDLPAQPNLMTIHRHGRAIPAVTQVTKMGLIFVLNRLTGQPLFPVEERAVPKSLVPGEFSWETQPFPLAPPPLARISIGAEDISTVKPESHSYCTKLFNSLGGRKIYSPIGCEQTLIVPGTLGGGNWSGSSFDPVSGYLYVNVNELPLVAAVNCQNENPTDQTKRLKAYARFTDPNGWPCQQPPWGTLIAVELGTGRIVWRVPLGFIEELKAQGVSGTGAPNLGGSLVTAGGLVFIGATTDARFRAFDAQSGRELWLTKLEASAHAAPITYQGRKTGKQYVVIAAGGGGYLSKQLSDALVAFSIGD